MSALVADTHVLVWYLLKPQLLSSAATAAIDSATENGEPVFVSAITLVELGYLVEKHRIIESDLTFIVDAIRSPDNRLIVVPLDETVAMSIRTIPRDIVPDMPDRIIAATSRLLGIPLVTRDSRIKACGIEVIW